MGREINSLVIRMLGTPIKTQVPRNARKIFRVRECLKITHLWIAVPIFALTTTAGNAVGQSWNLQELTKEAKALTASTLPSLRVRAQAGEARAQFVLGLAFEFGYAGLTKDNGEALRWFRKAADQGIGLPEKWVGDFSYAGLAGPKDFAEAMRWYRRSAQHGYAQGASFFAHMYIFGDGVAADHREAAKWYRRAAELGDLASKERIALFDSTCQDEFCVALRQIIHAVRIKGLGRYRGQQRTDLVGTIFYEGTKMLPGSKECKFDEISGSKAFPAYICSYELNPAEPEMTERFNNFVQRVKASLPTDWAGRVNKEGSHGWLIFTANPPLSDEERKELDARDWMGWEPLVKITLSGFSYLGKPYARLQIRVQLNS